MVDHIDVTEVGSGSFVGDVDGVLERQSPDGEGLELGVAGIDAFFVLVVELRERRGELAGARTGGGNDHERLGGLDIGVGAVALVGHNGVDIGGVAFGKGMKIWLDMVVFELLSEILGFLLTIEEGNDD